jgi:CheY-like chemotaxis protein
MPRDSDKLCILLVEDEAVVAMLIEDMLVDLGYEVGAVAVRTRDALQAIQSKPFDFAILDVNLTGETSYAIADVLAERGIPFVFATGYGVRGVDRKYAEATVLTKPFTQEDLEKVLPKVPVNR